MSELSQLSLKELAELTRETEDKAVLRGIAEQVGVTFSGNTGVETLKTKILAELILDEEPDAEDEELDTSDPVQAALAQHRVDEEEAEAAEQLLSEDDDDIYVTVEAGVKKSAKYSVAQMLEMDTARIKDPILRRNAIRAQALRLVRVKINNLDPADAEVPGALISLTSKYTGKVSKYVPYDEEQHPNGYHIPKMILDDLETRKFNLRKEIKKPGSSFGVKEYKTTKVKKFAIEVLPPLTREQLKDLARKQAASGAIEGA